jgi:hypothetical protein
MDPVMLGDLKLSLRAEIARRPDLFEATCRRRLALAAHTTAFSVLGVLNDELIDAHSEKDALTLALLDEYRESPTRGETGPTASYPTTLLLAAFIPMLRRLRSSIVPGSLDREDLDHLVIEAFLSAARAIPLDGRTRLPLRLKSRTRRAVFRYLGTHQLGRRKLDHLAEEVSADGKRTPFDRRRRHGQRDSIDPEEAASLAKLLVDRFGGSVEQSQLDLVIATLLHGESLLGIIQQQHPDLQPADRERLYQRIKRQHSRTILRLQKIWRGVEIVCPLPKAGGLFPLERLESPKDQG